MTLWDSGWRANLPWAGASDAFDRIADVNQSQMPALTTLTEGVRDGNWQMVHGVYDFAEDGGAVGHVDIFDVDGDVMVKVIGICETSVTEAVATSNMSLGTADEAAVLIASTPSATLDENEIWHDATPTDIAEKVDLYGETAFISNGANIRLTIADEEIDAGKINFYCFWKPLSTGATVVPA